MLYEVITIVDNDDERAAAMERRMKALARMNDLATSADRGYRRNNFV